VQAIRIEFEWTRFADYETEIERPGSAWSPGSLFTEASVEILVAVGTWDAALKTRPIENVPDLYLQLAKANPTKRGHHEFAKKHGLLTHPQRDYAYEWPKLVESMHNLVELVSERKNWVIQDGKYAPYDLPVKFALRLVPSCGETGMALSVVPDNLYQALVLQCAFNHASGSEIRPCKACGTMFEIGGSSGRNSKREFCSDRCRYEFSHRSRRKKQ
jgi:hypothetical protein